MLRLTLNLLLFGCLLMILSACGDSGSSSSGTVVTNQLVVPKVGGNYQEVRHIVLKGTNQDIGKALARLSNDYYQAQPMQFPQPTASYDFKSSRNSYIQQYFPQLAARQRGIEDYYGWGAASLNDSSALWYDMQPVQCSAIFFPNTVTANGHSFQARNMEFYTVDMYRFAVPPFTVDGHGNKLFSRNFVLETYPQDGGYATMVVGTFELVNGAYDGFNEHGLTISGLVDQELSKTGTVDLKFMTQQKGVSYLQMVRLILENARTVDEAQQLVSKLTVYFPLDGIHFLIGDRNGNAKILEFYKPTDASPLTPIFLTQSLEKPTIVPTILTNHSIRVYKDPSTFPPIDTTKPYDTFYRYMRLYNYLQASLYHYYTPEDGLSAMSLVYGYANDSSEGAAEPFPVRTIWSLVMDADDLSLKIKFYTIDNTLQKTPVFTDAFSFKMQK